MSTHARIRHWYAFQGTLSTRPRGGVHKRSPWSEITSFDSDSGRCSQIRFSSKSDCHSVYRGTKGLHHKSQQCASTIKKGRRRARSGRKRPHLGFRQVQPIQARSRRGAIRRRSCRLSEATHAWRRSTPGTIQPARARQQSHGQGLDGDRTNKADDKPGAATASFDQPGDRTPRAQSRTDSGREWPPHNSRTARTSPHNFFCRLLPINAKLCLHLLGICLYLRVQVSAQMSKERQP